MANKKAGGPHIYDTESLIHAGIDPKTGLPIKFISGNKEWLENNIRMMFRIMDEQDATNRYVWTGTEMLGLSSQEIERLLYYKGQLVFFYFKNNGKFYLMPYALSGGLDFYGRYTKIHPIPMTAGVDENSKDYANANAIAKSQQALLSQVNLVPVYTVLTEDEVNKEVIEGCCVILRDYTNQLSQNIIPRQQINDPIIGVMAETVPLLRTSLIAGSGIKGYRVNDADQEASVADANKSIAMSAKTGNLFIPITGAIEMQELTNGSQPIKSEEFMLALQSLDNIRRSSYGIKNGGVFEKKAHELEGENELNNISSMNQLQDGLSIRQNFCNIVNSIWGIGIWCEAAENIVMTSEEGSNDKDKDENESFDNDEGENEDE